MQFVFDEVGAVLKTLVRTRIKIPGTRENCLPVFLRFRTPWELGGQAKEGSVSVCEL
jgi:hypothetical protein